MDKIMECVCFSYRINPKEADTTPESKNPVSVHRQKFSELKIPYDTVLVADFADLECEVSVNSRYWSHV